MAKRQRFEGKWRKMRHAGLAHTLTAVQSRAMKRFASTALGRHLVPMPGEVDAAALLDAIDFEGAEEGDLVSRFIEHGRGRHVLEHGFAGTSFVFSASQSRSTAQSTGTGIPTDRANGPRRPHKISRRGSRTSRKTASAM